MQTVYNQTMNARIEGQAQGERKARDYTIPVLAQITTIAIADGSPAASEAWVLTATDAETGQIWTLPIVSGASLAASLDAAVAAVAANGKFNDLFTAAEDGATILTLTAKHVGRDYTLALDNSAGSATNTVAVTQASGGAKLAFGKLLARGAGKTCDELRATSTIRDIAGALHRTEANHTRQYDSTRARAGYDGVERGSTVSLMSDGFMVVRPETAPTSVSDSVFVRRAMTGAVGTVGKFSAAPSGGQQSYTFTPSAVDLEGYGFQFSYEGADYSVLYLGDGGTTVAQAVDGLLQDLGAVSGLTITDGATELTIQTAAGTALSNVRNLASHTDVPVDSVTIAESVAGDVDSIDISAIASWEELPDGRGLGLVRVSGI